MQTYFVLAALLIAAPVSVLAADTPASVQKTLQTDYNQRDSAFGRRDINATLLHYAPEFVGISSTGKLHDLKEERLDFLHTFALPIRSSVTKSTVEGMTLAKAGTEATLTVRRHGILVLISQTKGSDVLTLDGVFQDVWAKRPAGWLLTREQAQSVTATMNGKPI